MRFLTFTSAKYNDKVKVDPKTVVGLGVINYFTLKQERPWYSLREDIYEEHEGTEILTISGKLYDVRENILEVEKRVNEFGKVRVKRASK